MPSAPMANTSTAYLFPGQGSYYAGALRDIQQRRPEIRSVLEEMDGPAGDVLGVRISTELLDAPARPLESWVAANPDVLQLLLVAVGTATYRALRAEGSPPGLLVGHSLGELAALTAADVLTPAQASEIVCQRAIAIRQHATPGSMLALSAPPARVRTMLDLIGDDRVSVAVVNTDSQTVVAGPTDALQQLAKLAATVNVGTLVLQAPYAFHSPVLADASAMLYERIRDIRPGTPSAQVFSPILGRYYRVDDKIPALVAAHLIRPVGFAASIRELHGAGVDRFIESGALDILTRIVRRNLDDSSVSSVAPLPGRGDELESWRSALDALGIEARAMPQEAARNTPPSGIGPAATDAPTGTRNGSAPDRLDAPAPKRAQVLASLVALYAQALEYPEEVFGEDTDLEAELGVDSVKQTELLGRVSARFELPAPGEDFRVSQYGTLGHIADLVLAGAPPVQAEQAPVTESVAVVLPLVRHDASVNGRPTVLRSLVSLYAQALEYPEEVFAEDTDLEAELGVDSVKQTELLGRVSARFELPAPGEDFRVSQYGTLGHIADLVLASAGRPTTLSA